jgi:hypothetical protein
MHRPGNGTNGLRQWRAHYSHLRLTPATEEHPDRFSNATHQELINFAYEFDGASVSTIEDRRPATAVPSGDRAGIPAFRYDDLCRPHARPILACTAGSHQQ